MTQRHYFSYRAGLSSQEGCVLWGSHLVAPPSRQGHALNLLNKTQPGISRMKALAQLSLVASHGCEVGGAIAGVSALPTAPEEPSTGITAPMSVANVSLG